MSTTLDVMRTIEGTTPGPWRVEEGVADDCGLTVVCWYVVAANDQTVAECWSEADAIQIAIHADPEVVDAKADLIGQANTGRLRPHVWWLSGQWPARLGALVARVQGQRNSRDEDEYE